MKIGIVFENKDEIVSKYKSYPVETLYHWREPDEINALSDSLQKIGHEVELIAGAETLMASIDVGKKFDLIWNLSVGVISRSRTAIVPAILEHAESAVFWRGPCFKIIFTKQAILEALSIAAEHSNTRMDRGQGNERYT